MAQKKSSTTTRESTINYENEKYVCQEHLKCTRISSSFQTIHLPSVEWRCYVFENSLINTRKNEKIFQNDSKDGTF